MSPTHGDFMQENPTVSIIIPVYNRLTFVDQAITSALAQTRVPLEIIVVDDGSGVDVAGHLARWQGAVEYLHRINGGQGAARNTALARCRGDYVLFLDDDDCLKADAVEKLISAIKNTPGAVWAAGAYEYTDADGEPMGRTHVPELNEGDALRQMIGANPIGAPLAVLLKADVVREVGGFDENRRLQSAEDHDLWTTMARRYRPALTREIVACYRKHPQNATGNQTKHLDARLAMLEKQRELSGMEYARHFETAEAAIHREYGDVCYLSGRQVAARLHWAFAAGGGGLSVKERLVRVAKSFLPPGAREMLRRSFA